MEKPKPLETDLTKQGKPRQRAPGAGRPNAGRSVRLSLVSEACKAQLKEIIEVRGIGSQAEVIEEAVAALHRKSVMTQQ